MALVEYKQHGHRNYIFIPEDRDGRGWRKLVEALREPGRDGRGVGLEPPATTATTHQHLAQLYMEALQILRILDYARGRGSLGASCDVRSGSVVTVRDQSSGEGGRSHVGLKKEMVLRALAEMQSQIEEL